MKLGNGDKTQ